MQKAGKYEILRKIGAGGFGVVYEGRDPFIKRRVAIKTCTSEDEDIRQRFFREAEIAGNLQHRNIVTIHDFGFEEGVPYLVQEFLPGEDLSQMVARREPLSLARKLDLLLQTAHGMAFAHSQGVIHRDIKPNNIRVLEDWRVKIMDFGIAKLANVESNLTKEGMTVGTAAYLPPEQIRGDKVDTRADIFSYGVLAYELLTYSRPFDGKTLSTLLFQILSQEPKPLLEVWPEAPPRVAKLVAHCLEKDAAKRCSTFEIVEQELEAAIAQASVIDDTNLIAQQPASSGEAAVAASRPSSSSADDVRTELGRVNEKVRRAIAAGDLTAAELELTLAEKGWGRNTSFAEIVGSLRGEIVAARHQQEEERRRIEKLRLLLGRGVERLDAGEFAEARVAFEAALDLDRSNAEGAEGIARADAGLAWLESEALRLAQVSELVREGRELLARGEPEPAAAKARAALAVEAGSAEAAQLLAAAEERARALAAAAERRREEERRARAAAEAERQRVEIEAICRVADELLEAGEADRAAAEARRALALDGASLVARAALGRAEAELRRLAQEAELRRRREAEAAERERREQEEAAERARRLQELGEAFESQIARGALGKAEKLLAKGERELGAEACAPWRERLAVEQRAVAEEAEREQAAAESARQAAEAEKREAQAAKRAAAAEAVRQKEEQRQRAASAKADLARAKTLEATAGTQLPSASFASAKLTDPQTLKWIGGAAAALAVAVLGLWLALGRRSEPDLAATSSPRSEPQSPASTSDGSPGTGSRPTATQTQASPSPAAVVPQPQIPAPAPTAVASPATTVESPAIAAAPVPEPSALDLALGRGRAELAAGNRRGALAAFGEALRLVPGNAATLAILGELRREEQRRVAAGRQKAVAAGADRLAAATFQEAELAAKRSVSTDPPVAAVEAAWLAVELFAEATKEAGARQKQAAIETAPAAVAPTPAPKPPAAVEPAPSLPSAAAEGAAPTPAPAPAPAPAAAAPSRTDTDAAAGVLTALYRYRAANESLDANALRSVWTIDESAARQIARAFSSYNSLAMTLEGCRVELQGETATARCRVTQKIDVKVGSDIRSVQDVTFELGRSGDGWLIRSRTAR